MVDGVNFNPFTGKVWTTDEIEKIDTDQNGVVSYEEIKSNLSWITSSTADEEGEVVIDENAEPAAAPSKNESNIYSAAKKNGVKDSAANSNELKSYMNTVIDSYIEQYMQKNPGMDQNQKSTIIMFIKAQGEEFVNNYLQNNTAVPYDTKSVAQQLIQSLDSAVQQRNETAAEVNNQLNDYKNNVDSNYDKLSATTNKADDDYVTAAEFQQMKEEAIAYLLGTILNGAEDSEFLSGLNPNYKNDANYKSAMSAINSIQNETDPAKIQQYLEQAKTALENLIGTQNADGTSKLNDTVLKKDSNIAQAVVSEQKSQYAETLQNVVDEMVENFSDETVKRGILRKRDKLAHSEQDVQNYQALLNNIMNKFLETYKGDGTNIEADFRAYANNVMSELNEVTNELYEIISTSSADKIEELEQVIDNAGTYISNDEKDAVIDKTSEFIMNQLAQGNSDISLLKQILPDYASNENFVEATALLKGLTSSVTPKEDLEKVKQLIKEMISDIDVNKIADAVKNRQMPEVKFSDIELEDFTSSIPGYDNNDKIESAELKGKDRRQDVIDNLQQKAKAKLEALRAQILEMIKQKVGADYDEETANKLFDDAVYQTINDITDSIGVDRSNHLIKKRRKWTASISTQTLVDTFIKNFQNLSSKDAAGTEEGKNPVDRESVIKNTSLADAYQDKSVTMVKGLSEAKTKVKSQIAAIAAQLKAQLRAELGSNYNSAKINQLIEQATYNTVDAIAPLYQGNSQLMKHTLGNTYKISAYSTANKFFDEFDKLYQDAYKTSQNNK